VRIRIALTTAIAVITGMTSGIFALSIGRQPVSAQAASQHSAHAAVTLPDTALAGFRLPLKVPTTTTTAANTATQIPTPTSTTTTTTTTTTPPPPPPPPPPPVTDADNVATADWMCIRVHESGDQYNDPAAPSGAYGILISTWRSFGYSGWPYQAPASVQDQLALKLYALYGFKPWSSRFACGL
jgi:hypothetical protein